MNRYANDREVKVGDQVVGQLPDGSTIAGTITHSWEAGPEENNIEVSWAAFAKWQPGTSSGSGTDVNVSQAKSSAFRVAGDMAGTVEKIIGAASDTGAEIATLKLEAQEGREGVAKLSAALTAEQNVVLGCQTQISDLQREALDLKAEIELITEERNALAEKLKTEQAALEADIASLQPTPSAPERAATTAQ